MPYISVIIPTLNEEKYLPKLLNNLNQQTFTDFDVTVVDGQSEDATPELVNNFTARFPLKFITTSKRNVSHQRNLGAKSATAKVLVFFDADTQIPKNYLEKIYQIFESKKPHFVTTYLRVDSRKPSEQWFAIMSNVIFEISRIMKTPAAYGAMQAIKRTVFEDIGGYDELTKFAEDTQLFQIAQDYNYKFHVAPTPRYIFSLRRLRAEGTVDTITQFLKLNIAVTLNGYHVPNIQYEMGGSRYNTLKKSRYTRRFDTLFQKLQKKSLQQTNTIKAFLDKYLSF